MADRIGSHRKGVADDVLAKSEIERGRKRDRQSEDPEIRTYVSVFQDIKVNLTLSRKRMRSASSASVSTVSTNLSQSPSPRRKKSHSVSSPRQNVPSRPGLSDSEKKRRRDSYSSEDSYDARTVSRERDSIRSTRRRFQQASPQARGRRPTESQSPTRERRKLSNDRQRGRGSLGDNSTTLTNNGPPKERSLSPFSKRLALTQAMNS